MLICFCFLIPIAIFVFACSRMDVPSCIMLYTMICCGKLHNLVNILKSEMQTRLLLDDSLQTAVVVENVASLSA